MSNLTIRIAPKLKRQLQKLCAQQNRPISDLVRESLRRYIAQEQLRALREQLRPYAEARGFLADDDVFRAIS
jgi:predicted transcriptional regulator